MHNPLVREGLTPASVLRAFREPAEANWVPLTWISLQLGYTLHGLAPAGFLLTNVALHALASVLLFFALLRLTAARLGERLRRGRVRPAPASRRVGRLGSLAQGRALGRVLHADAARVGALRRAPVARALRGLRRSRSRAACSRSRRS